MNAALIKCQGKVVGISYRESAQLVTDYHYVKHSQLAKHLCSSCRSISAWTYATGNTPTLPGAGFIRGSSGWTAIRSGLKRMTGMKCCA